jgi:hypothetical protein
VILSFYRIFSATLKLPPLRILKFSDVSVSAIYNTLLLQKSVTLLSKKRLWLSIYLLLHRFMCLETRDVKWNERNEDAGRVTKEYFAMQADEIIDYDLVEIYSSIWNTKLLTFTTTIPSRQFRLIISLHR